MIYDNQCKKEELIPYLYEGYLKEMSHFTFLNPISETQFKACICEEMENMQCVYAKDENGYRGAIFYSCWEEDEMKYCNILVFGYFAETEDILADLFGQLADKIVKKGTYTFLTHLYAHDEMSIRLFSMMQFGMISEKGIRKIDEQPESERKDVCIKLLSKEEMIEKWSEVWTLTNAIVEHLKGSPIFYPGEEFTEEIYKEFYLDEDTHVYAAFSKEGKMIGIIESNMEADQIAFGEKKSINVGEAYVIPQYRRTGVSKALLSFAEHYEKTRGASYSWVEHGTANPNARRF